MKKEFVFALKQPRLVERIIPLVYQPCDVDEFSWTLSSYQMVDFTGSFENGCRDLLRIWGMGYKPK